MLGLEGLERNRLAHEAAHQLDVGSFSGSQRLNHDIAHGSSFRRARNHGDADGICRPLVEQLVAASSADDVQHFYRIGRKRLKVFQHLAVAQGKALEDAAHDLPARLDGRLLVCRAIRLDGFFHIRRVGEDRVIGRNQVAERFAGIRLGYQFGIRSLAPSGTATLQEPHAADILQQTDGTVHSAFVRKVQSFGIGVDDRRIGLHPHQRPRAAAQVSEVLVLRRNRSHRRCRIVSGYGNHGHGSQPGDALHLFGKRAHGLARIDKAAEVVFVQHQAFQQLGLQAARLRVHQLGGRGNGIFAHHLARKHIAQRVGDKEELVCRFQRTVLVAEHRVELEYGIEVHHLNAGQLIHPAARHPFEILPGSALGMRVAVRIRLAQQASVLAHAYEIHAPRIDADRSDFDVLTRRSPFQPLQNVPVKFVDIPVEVSPRLDDMIGETVHFFCYQSFLSERAYYRTPAGSPEVDGEKAFCHSLFRV